MKIPIITHTQHRRHIEKVISDGEAIDQHLVTAGPGVIHLLMQKITLRQIARRSKRSPTYISHIKNGKTPVSWETYCLLVMMLEESEKS